MMPSNVKVIKVGDSDVGIVDLKKTFREIYFLEIEDEGELRERLLAKVKTNNFIPAEKEYLYAEALLREYRSFVEMRYRGKKISLQPAGQSSPGFLNFPRRLAGGKRGKK